MKKDKKKREKNHKASPATKWLGLFSKESNMLLIELTVLVVNNNIKPGVPFAQGRYKQNQGSAKVRPPKNYPIHK